MQFQHEAVACETARGVLAPGGSTVRCDDTEQVARGVEVVAWTLHCSHRFARDLVDLGAAMTQRLPAVGAAYQAGLLDHGRANAFADSLRGIADDDLARSIADRLLGHAPQQTLGQLRDALRFHMDKRDPHAQRRRYQTGHAHRRVWLRQNPDDGTASLCAAGLSPVAAARAFDRLDRIARCARADADPRNLAQLRADAMVDILIGQPFTLHPTTDPTTADADAANPVPDRGHHPPHWRPTPTTGADPRPSLTDLLLANRSRFTTGTTQPPPDPDDHDDGGSHDDSPGHDESVGHDDGGRHGDGGDRPSRQDRPTSGLRTGSTDGSRFTTGSTEASRFATGTTEPPTPPDPDDGDGPPPDEPPPLAETRGMDEFEYDRACLTDQDLWWVQSADHDSTHIGVLNPDVLPGDRCAACSGRIIGTRRGIAEVSLKLTTLLRLDDDPA